MWWPKGFGCEWCGRGIEIRVAYVLKNMDTKEGRYRAWRGRREGLSDLPAVVCFGSKNPARRAGSETIDSTIASNITVRNFKWLLGFDITCSGSCHRYRSTLFWEGEFCGSGLGIQSAVPIEFARGDGVFHPADATLQVFVPSLYSVNGSSARRDIIVIEFLFII